RMDQCVRLKNFFQLRQRSPRCKQQPSAIQLVPLLFQVSFHRAKCLTREFLRLRSHTSDEFAGLRESHLLPGVIRLPERVTERLHQVGALASQNNWLSFFEGDSNDGTPAGVHTKTNRSFLHEDLRGRGETEEPKDARQKERRQEKNAQAAGGGETRVRMAIGRRPTPPPLFLRS